MKKFIVFLIGASMFLASGIAQATTLDFAFTSLIKGAMSYNATQNVVTPGTSFYDTTLADGRLDMNGVVGNLAFYGVVKFANTDPDFAWAAAHGNQLLDIEVRFRDLNFDFDRNGVSDLTDNWRIVGWQDGTNYLTTFNALGAHGYTQLTAGVWMDVALGPDYAAYGGNPNGLASDEMAISIIANGAVLQGYPNFDALLLAGPLGSGYPTIPNAGVVESGIRANTVPEPATMLLLGLGLVGLAGIRRKFQK